MNQIIIYDSHYRSIIFVALSHAHTNAFNLLCVEMTDVTSEHLLSCVDCKHSVISQVIQQKKTKLYVLNLDCESVHVLNISTLSDTCTLLFPQGGDSLLHYAALGGHLDSVKFFLQHGADLSLCNEVSVIVN